MSKAVEATPRTSASGDAEAQQQKIQSEHVDRAEDIHVDGEQGKFSAILGILRKLVGVADVVDLRLSLPSQLLDPIPNLEYWNYMESPKHFVAIPESDDAVERMLAVLAWWFSKMLKHTGKVHKPFNSILGERFFCHWDVSSSSQCSSESTASSSITNVSTGAEATNRVEYITEQVSHHPPVSAFVYRCKERGIEAAGIDHIKAKFTGLSATVATGSECKGIFITLKSRGNEMYKCTHPTGSIVGWLRGSLKVQMIETSYIVCAKTGLAAVVEFKEERWFSKDKGNVIGKVFRYDESKYGDQIASWRLKDIPKACSIVATFGGNWDQQVTVKHNGSERTLIDMAALKIADKIVKPLEQQGELESRRVWEPVASKMRQGKYAEASRTKKAIEEAQRTLAAERKERGEEFVPALFKPNYADSGMPELLDDAPINI
ncbi:oxysterol-binding protein-like protein [Coemansia mojavensis]|nr:oxysterol-binding protein-like protein [Coemansia mojavensis]